MARAGWGRRRHGSTIRARLSGPKPMAIPGGLVNTKGTEDTEDTEGGGARRELGARDGGSPAGVQVKEDVTMQGRSVDLTDQVLGAAIAVHRALGPGLLESTYEACLAFELVDRGLNITRQAALPVVYRDVRIDCGYRLDLVVNGEVIVEIKAVERILPVHEAQILTYLRLSSMPVALLLNFNVPLMKDGIKRFVGRPTA